MSRVGNIPIEVPSGVKVKLEGRKVVAAGPLGELSLSLPEPLGAELENGRIRVKCAAETKRVRSLHGLYARLIHNMLQGVSRGFEKRLEVMGVGYRAQMEGAELVLQLGFSHPVRFSPPLGVKIRTDGTQVIVVTGPDKQKVGEIAAHLRRFRPPEPYKGKGIRYQGEWVRRKVGKTIA